MAIGFIKKVFTFRHDQPGFNEVPAELLPDEDKGLAAELEPKSREEHLPEAADPVLPAEMETAGGPAADGIVGDAEDDTPPILPVVTALDDLGVTPLALLEAEAEIPEGGATPPSVPAGHLPRKGGDQTESGAAPTTIVDSLADLTSKAAPAPISPLVGEMSAKLAEGGELASQPTIPSPPILPKGFSTGPAIVAPVPESPKTTWFQRLRAGLSRTSSQLTGQITALFTKRKLDDQTLQDLEDLLIQADLGVETALRITDALASERYGKDVSGEDVSRIMAAEIVKVLKPVAKPLQLDLSHKPHVILVVGVNGTGKTTTIGKLASKLSGSGLKVMVAAGDTFRAAAIEQLKIWADRTKSTFVGTKIGADASGLAFDAFQQAKADGTDVLIIDTAGRLQNKKELMDELEKIVRVLGKLDPEAPHTVLQTLDATTGQNALNQVEIFRNVAGVNGLIMTKLDGTARGGILVAISAKHKLPVYFIGVGEGVDDLEPFEAEEFAQAIAGIDG
ncbi:MULTISPECIES: signal recognition particle-docking protein FtsY [Rhizobium]|uniref:Signal recognition particle receptor FtsY n=1 Tax=Rhizobium rhododendri TaxID=2506430 RepID=A0ABY8IGX2_9HYPH|nr:MULTISPECIES: signal recognition particle-docking protein FtsY [Rhizobium]MBZ5760786.1 signal recognition particle-docking protein FtsY [Rhizobium sp. VS19-DR96]MBZ5765430.1 signal recognition particle-docking protein FtsY [Rhizobium sp. VS19-DR129.2]MBZ5774607.1 signal recognition particle-docking protein FtsY [Rhizobium sp. VS19-DRK62.2]MBZ5784621.1 signal recognition particle-docking protein FtsY [Rhizobium sp. VS19-DR121]MBZ5801233.1 signal recognition particle-docking protein FtsY [Rhi